MASIITGHWKNRKNQYLPLHQHEAIEIVYVVNGSTQWKTSEQIERLSKGDLFFSLPEQEHGGIGKPERNELIWIQIPTLQESHSSGKDFSFEEDFPLPKTHAARIIKTLTSQQNHRFKATPSFEQLMTLVQQNISQTHSSNDLYLKLLAASILLELEQSIAQTIDHASNSSDEQDDIVQNFMSMLSERCGEHWTLQSMASAMGYGRTHFSKLIKKQTGDTPTMLLSRFRAERAAELLRNTNRSITDISLDLGFSSSQYFSTVFKQYQGESPQAFRNKSQL